MYFNEVHYQIPAAVIRLLSDKKGSAFGDMASEYAWIPTDDKIQEEYHVNRPFFYKRIAVKSGLDISKWCSEMPCDRKEGLEFGDTLAYALMASLYSTDRMDSFYRFSKDGTEFYLLLENRKSSFFQPGLSNNIFSDENDYVELEFMLFEDSVRSAACFVAGLHTKCRSYEEVISYYSGEEFWSDTDGVRDVLSSATLYGAFLEIDEEENTSLFITTGCNLPDAPSSWTPPHWHVYSSDKHKVAGDGSVRFLGDVSKKYLKKVRIVGTGSED